MDISLDFFEDKAFMKVGGTVLSEDTCSLRDCLNKVLASEARILEMDLSGCKSMCSSGIGKILYFFKDFQEKEGQLEVVKSSPAIYELFTTIKLNQLFPVSI